jgi:hypothetical protein
VRPDVRHIKLVVLLLAVIGYNHARAENLEAKLGLEQTTAISPIYGGKQKTALQFEGTYSKAYTGRWHAFAQYQANKISTLSAGIVGFIYDSADMVQKGGAINYNGTAEITRMPLWLFRGSFGLGLFNYVDILKSNDPTKGTKNDVPVQAPMIGVKIGGHLVRMMDTDWGVSGNFSYSLASTTSFGISSNCISVGVIYRGN